MLQSSSSRKVGKATVLKKGFTPGSAAFACLVVKATTGTQILHHHVSSLLISIVAFLVFAIVLLENDGCGGNG